jgi:hypothetical protein
MVTKVERNSKMSHGQILKLITMGLQHPITLNGEGSTTISLQESKTASLWRKKNPAPRNRMYI